MLNIRRNILPVLLIVCFLTCLAACDQSPLSRDDITQAKNAVAAHDWPLAERLSRRALRTEHDLESRWEAWNMLLASVNAEVEEPQTSLEYLEVMLEEFSESEGRSKTILERMGRYAEILRRFSRAADIWNSYVELEDIEPAELVDGYRRLAQTHFNRRHFEAGDETLHQCLALSLPERDKNLCLYDLADQNMTRQRWQEVTDLCLQMLDNNNFNKELRGLATYLLADALEQLGRGKDALARFEQARADYPNSAVIDNRIMYLRKKLK